MVSKIKLIEILRRIRETCIEEDEIEAMDEAIRVIRWQKNDGGKNDD